MQGTGENWHVDGDRLWASLMQMAAIGPGVAGGNNRQTLTDEDGAARALLARWCDEAGLARSTDSMGNMFALRPGTDPDAAPVWMGSHLDTQPTGGRFDGVLGVLGGLEVIRRLNDLGLETRRPVGLINWTNEEGTRFPPAMLGSSVFAGLVEESWAKTRTDRGGNQFGAELRRIGWEGTAPVGAQEIHALFELHIEQGPVLEAEGLAIGVVTHAQGQVWLQLTIEGVAAHSGSTPMGMRRDAGRAMARVIEKVEEIALSHAPAAVGTVGRAEIFPNSPNVIPGKAVFMVDFRAPDEGLIGDMDKRLRREAARICGEMGLGLGIEKLGGFAPVGFDPACIDAVRSAAETLGLRHSDMLSGAGHDACAIARIAPVGMIFCPCKGGLSHNEAEDITPEWARAGGDVLFHAVTSQAGVMP